MRQVFLLTGRPGTGKTSLIKEALDHAKVKAGGFYTEEVRSRGVRQGFKLVTLDGREALLSHVGIHSRCRVSKYGVDVDILERVGVPTLDVAARQCQLTVIDEIGKMELFSEGFRQAVSRLIDSGNRILGTIMLSPDPWADAIKHRPEVELVAVTRVNREAVLKELLAWLQSVNSARQIVAGTD